MDRKAERMGLDASRIGDLRPASPTSLASFSFASPVAVG
jgi:hypothetical protein